MREGFESKGSKALRLRTGGDEVKTKSQPQCLGLGTGINLLDNITNLVYDSIMTSCGFYLRTIEGMNA